MERPEIVAARDRFVGGLGISQRLVGADGDEAIEGDLRPLGTGKRRLHDLDRGRLAGLDQGSDLGGAEPSEVVGHCGSVLPRKARQRRRRAV